MRGFWKKLRRNCKGAVTVIVTLLLIPGVLISGLGVDVARIYVAQSVLHDANQLAANSVLASYDALLQDLYGLYGIMKNDDEFATLVDKYIQVAVLGEDWNDKSLGSFQLFYGSALNSAGITPADGMNLANEEVLRRQIEEYAKFRAPAVIVEEIIERLQSFSQVQADSEIIKDKLDIEDDLEDLDEIYKRIYEKIQDLNGCKSAEENLFQCINDYIDDIQEQFEEMYNTRDDYEQAVANEDEELAGDYSEKYNGHIQNIKALINGGTIREGYFLGGINAAGVYQNGYWSGSQDVAGLDDTIRDLKDVLNAYKSELDELVTLCRQADSVKESLKTKINNLENKLNSGSCSQEMKEGVQPKIEEYRKLVGQNLESMAQTMKSQDEVQINNTIALLDEIVYGDPSTGNSDVRRSISLSSLGSLSQNGDYYIRARLDDNRDYLYEITSITPQKYSPSGTFKLFQECGTENEEFYSVLESLYQSGDHAKKQSITKNLENAMGQIQRYFTGLLEFEPEGAWVYENGGDTSDSDNGTNFGSDGDWSKSGEGKKQVKTALSSNLVTRLGSALADAGNKILLLTYDSEMFSCYSTNKRSGEDAEVSMSGIPLGIDVNYYYQSELEYLYHGNLQDAKANLKTVTGMIFLVRFVMDYVVSFTVSDVTDTVEVVESALSWSGPFAIAAGELTRVVMALGEAAMDTSRLKNGDYVAFIKNSDTWRFSITGITGTLEKLDFSDDADTAKNDDDNLGLSYKDYLRIFLLLVDGDTLAQRTAKLIALNVTNKQNSIGSKGDHTAREAAMASTTLFDMSSAITDFSITTTAELKMLFLSMPFAQKGVNGVVPPGTKELTVTDYRGY